MVSIPSLKRDSRAFLLPKLKGLLEHPLGAIIFLLGWCGFLFGYGITAGDLYRTEGLRALMAQGILNSGNWVVPTLYGEPLLTKPPGMFAAMALVSWPWGGVTTWSARLPSVLAASGTVFLFYWFFRRQLGPPAGLIAATFLPVSFMWLDRVPSAEIDMLQVFWVSASILFFLRALEQEEDTETRRRGDTETRRHGDAETRRHGDAETRRRGDAETRRHGDGETQRHEDGLGKNWVDEPEFPKNPISVSPCLRVSVSPCLRVFASPWWLLALLCVAGGFLTKWTAPVFFYATVLPLLWWRGQLRLLWGKNHLFGVILASGICLGWASLAVAQTGWDVFASKVGQEASQHLLPRELPGGEALGHQKPYPWMAVLTHPFLVGAGGLPWSVFALVTFVPGFSYRFTPAGQRTFQAMLCWTWVNLLFWSIIPGNSPRHSFPLLPGMAGLAALTWYAWLSGRLSWPWPFLSPKSLLAGLLVAWLVVKLVFVHVVIPIRNENRAPREKGQKIAFLVPPEQTLYLYGLKDEGLMFYYSRCHPKGENDRLVRRLKGLNALPSSSEPVYCILTEREWQNWDRGREGEVIFYLTDQQNDPIVLLRVKPKSETLIRSRERSVNRGTQSRSTSLSYADEKYGYLIPS